LRVGPWSLRFGASESRQGPRFEPFRRERVPPRSDSSRATAVAILGARGCAEHGRRAARGSPSKALHGRGLPNVWSMTVGPPWGNDRELSARSLILGRRLLRVRVGAPVFVSRAVPLWSETFDFGGQRTAARTRARTPHRQANEGQDQRDARPVAGDAVEALVELLERGAWLPTLRSHHRPPLGFG
jgi:hypothetical protein